MIGLRMVWSLGRVSSHSLAVLYKRRPFPLVVTKTKDEEDNNDDQGIWRMYNFSADILYILCRQYVTLQTFD
jgi:hypothetical protein